MKEEVKTPSDLPSTGQIETDRVLSIGAIYASFQLEKAGVFAAADRIVDLERITGRTAEVAVAEYVAARRVRLTGRERAQLYCRALGVGCADTHEAQANRDFDSLWMRFVSAVNDAIEGAARQEAIRKAGRDLAANLSLNGWGATQAAATQLQAQLAAALKLLSTEEIRSAFGARDAWQVIDAVGTSELGGAPNIARHRALAVSGLTILRWVAAAARDRAGTSPTKPADQDLVDACEMWLAATGSPDDRVSDSSEPDCTGDGRRAAD
jgi:hypothetical protein